MQRTVIFDRLPLAGLRRDSAGNVVGVARAARTGIQVYAGYEVGRPEMRQVRVWRPEAEVFSRESMASFAGVPVTIEHPREFITPENWKDYAVGETASEDIVRDGESVKVPFLIRDEGGIKAIEDGKHEVSMGYYSMLDFQPGIVPDGQADAGSAYDAVQRKIRINHLAIVDKARGGPTLRIGDGQNLKEKNVKTIMVDGLSVEVTDAAEAAIAKLLRERDEARAGLNDAQTQIGTLTAEKATLDGKVKQLETALADATSPAKLAAAANARAKLLGDAKRLCPNGEFSDATDSDIMRACVEHKLGAVGKALADEAIPGAFAALVASLGDADDEAEDGATMKRKKTISDGSDRLARMASGGGDEFIRSNDSLREFADRRAAALEARKERYRNFGKTKERAA